MRSDAFTFICVPPITDAKPTAAAEELFLRVNVSPADRVTMRNPVFCWVPAPDPYTLPTAWTPFTNSANWFGSVPDTEKSIA